MSTSDIVSIATYGFLAILFFICGKKWSKGKWLNLMAGYNDRSDEEKKEESLEKTKRVGSYLMYISTIWSLLKCLIHILNSNNLISKLFYIVFSSIVSVGFLVLVIVFVFVVNKK